MPTHGTAAPARKSAAKRAGKPTSARRRSRVLALLGLYQWLVGAGDAAAIDATLRSLTSMEAQDNALLGGADFDALGLKAGDRIIDADWLRDLDFAGCDAAHFDALLHGAIAEAEPLREVLKTALDRPVAELSPIEHGALLIGAYELAHCLDVPYKVAINEAVELAKEFGGTDGHRFVNGVLDKSAAHWREAEVQAARSKAR